MKLVLEGDNIDEIVGEARNFLDIMDPTPPDDPLGDANPTPPDSTAPSGLEVDKAGFPWNEEIHSGEGTKTVKGLWTKKRGADKDRTAFLEAEWTALAATTEAMAPADDPLNPSLPLDPLNPGGGQAMPNPNTPPAVTDPVAACLERATAAIGTAQGDPAIRTNISRRINEIMGEYGIGGPGASDALMNSPDKAVQILPKLQALCVECGA